MKPFFLFLTSTIIAVSVSAQIAPNRIANPDPIYPGGAAELGYGGTVKVAIKVDKKGGVKVLQSLGPNAPCSKLDDGRIKRFEKR